MSNIHWSQEQIMLFLETLQTETIIWDPNDKCHKDKKKMNDAWLRIRDIFGGNTVEELKKKKDSLFATYRGYCRKIQASLKSGAGVDDVYRPVWFAFEFMNSFLGSVFKCKQTTATDQETGSIEEENNSSEGVVSTASATVKDQNSIEPSQTRHAIRRRDNPPELQIASKQMTEAFNNLNKIINNKPAKDSTEVEDECDVFGKLIAKKLKKLPEHKREDLMFDIHALLRTHLVNKYPIQRDLLQNGTLDESTYRAFDDDDSTNQSVASKRKKYVKACKEENVDVLENSETDQELHNEPEEPMNIVRQMHSSQASDDEWLNDEIYEAVETYEPKRKRMKYRKIKRELQTPPPRPKYAVRNSTLYSRAERPDRSMIEPSTSKDEYSVFGEYVGNKLPKIRNVQARGNVQQLMATILWQAEYGDSMETVKRVLLHSVQEIKVVPNMAEVIVQESGEITTPREDN